MVKDFETNAERDRATEMAGAGRLMRNALGFTAVLGWAFAAAARAAIKTKPVSPWFFKAIGWLGMAAGIASTLGFVSAAKTIREAKKKVEAFNPEAVAASAADDLSPDDAAEGKHVRHLHHSKNHGRSRYI